VTGLRQPDRATGLPEGLSLVEAGEEALLRAIYRLRVRAWRARNASFPDIGAWSDPFDEIARHWAVLDAAGQPVAAARLTVHPTLAEAPDANTYGPQLLEMQGPIGSFNRLVVAPEYGGRGLMEVLDEVRVGAARVAGCRFALLATRAGDRRIAAVRRLGFEVVGQASHYADGPLASTDGLDALLLKRLT
jgi:GNAT superfamily N-acetyltransferase